MSKVGKRVVIIGGGIGGLCTAVGLARAGVEVAVYERADAPAEVGAGITLWANALRGLRKLGLADRVIAAGARIGESALRDWRGKLLRRSHTGEFEQLFGEPTVALHRARLHEILLAALPPGCVRFGASCVGFEQDESGVTIQFETERTERAALLIGADGVQSIVRGQLFPTAAPRYAGYTAWRAVVPMDAEAALGFTSESWGRGARFGIVPVSRREIYWFATANVPDGMKLKPGESKGTLAERFRGWHQPIEKLIELTPADTILHNDIYDLEPLSHWSQGRVTLLGDAAHATTPNLGQGACQAIESSVALARLLPAEPDLRVALSRYEGERMARTAWITRTSRRLGEIGQWENGLACALRDFALRMTPAGFTRRTVIQAVGIE